MKIRGQRLESAEVENSLTGSGLVQYAITSRSKIAWALSSFTNKLAVAENILKLQKYVAERLPVHAIPKIWLSVEEWQFRSGSQ